MKIKFIILGLLLMSNLLIYKSTHAETVLDPQIKDEIHLTTANSPYLSSEEGLTVLPNSKLIIDPGVTILFPEYSSLYIDHGELLILGENNQRVNLQGKNSVTWTGLLLDHASSSINSLEIENSYKTIEMENSTSSITNLLVDGSKNTIGPGQYGLHSINSSLDISSSSIINYKTAGIYQEGGISNFSWNFIKNNGIGIQYNFYWPPVLFGPTKNEITEDYPLIANYNLIENNTINAKNISEESTIDMRNNYWGNSDGPESSIIGDILSSPWLNIPPVNEINHCCSSILFIPGLEGTRLNKDSNQLWEPNRNTDVEKLYLNSNGESIDPSVSLGQMIKKTNIGFGIFDQSIYNSFSTFLDGLVKNKIINEWTPYPYDWRLDLPVSSSIKIIEDLSNRSFDKKVTLIGHSNGGLMAKKIIEELKKIGEDNLISSVVLVATPQIGAPQTLGALLHGDDQSLLGGIVLNKGTAREFGGNMPGAYNLLPFANYISANPLITFSTSTDLSSNLRTLYGNSLNTFDSIKNFLLGFFDHRIKPLQNETEKPAILNNLLFDQFTRTQDDLAKWQLPSGLKVYQIGGIGLPTSNGINYFSKSVCASTAGPTCIQQSIFQHENVKDSKGDGVVPISSSLFLGDKSLAFNMGKYNKQNGERYSHATFMEALPVQEVIEEIIRDKNYATSTPYISYNENGINSSMLLGLPVIHRYGVHSPVTLNAYDINRKHTGVFQYPNDKSDIMKVETNIPGTSYEEIGTDKYLYTSDDTPLFLEMKGTDTGLFNFDIQSIDPAGEIKTLAEFKDIPVTRDSISYAETSPTSSVPTILKMDADGDGKIDISISKDTQFLASDYLKLFVINLKKFNLSYVMQQRAISLVDKLKILWRHDKNEEITKKLKNLYRVLGSKNLPDVSDLVKRTLDSLEIINLNN